MNERRGVCLGVLGLAVVLFHRGALGEVRLVDDEGVLPARRASARVGLGGGQLSAELLNDRTYHAFGGGVSVEGAIGIGVDVEVGARVGHRLSAEGAGMRADEIARMEDTETYGTGLAAFPNPELRIRWRAWRWMWGEAGLEDRLVIPLEDSRRIAEVIGGWVSLHVWRRARADFGVNTVFERHRFAGGTVVEPGIGVPLRLWANLTNRIFVGVIAAPHHFWGTSFTSAHTEMALGVGVGYRIRHCDVMELASSRDALHGVLTRVGLGIGITCKL